jgi:hypothetical protein
MKWPRILGGQNRTRCATINATAVVTVSDLWGGLVTAETQICSGRASVCVTKSNVTDGFYILFTVHPGMIHGKWPTWRTIIFYEFISIL